MSHSPLVTIGLPVYNSERYVEQSLKSLLGQTHSDFILIISDNASTDSTPQICKRYADADGRIKYFRNATNIGNPRNFNRIAELTETPYLKWSTADDYWAPTFLEHAMQVMERDPSLALCYPQAYLIDADDANAQVYEDALHLQQDDPADRFITLLDRIKLSHQHLGVIRMSHLRQTHLLGTHVGSDLNLLSELALYGKFFELPERLFYRRFHKDSGSWVADDEAHALRTYYAGGMRRAPMWLWPQHLAYFSSVRTSPLPAASKWRLFRYLLKRTYWNRRGLADELLRSVGLGSK